MIMPRTLNGHLALRLTGILLLVLLCLALQGLWLKELANDKARENQLTNAREHYAVVLADLDRRWGREAVNLKTRIEAQEILDSKGQRNDKLLAYLISQGSSIEFPSLRIEKTNGEVLAAYDYAGHVDPKMKFAQGQVSTWAQNPADGQLYLVIRQFIWLGKENGYLVLFKPMDHAALTQITYPGTRLSLWWKGKTAASSDGEDGLRRTAASFAKPENGSSSVALTWSGPESEASPKLLVETLASELIDADHTARPVMLLFFVLLIAIAVSFSALWLRASRQIEALVQADQRFHTLNAIDGQVAQWLRAAHHGPVESARQLADSLEQHMRATAAGHEAPTSPRLPPDA
ncbi:MAG: hypothetical protein CVU18_01075 [Betaproteobacteria bacterium HGW-Betaproteobacteria-12]|nr:MAG: hypothetical protein CVU18_01075 [Betaproteobacteria bacterium HGW-Betaproteobacteria-12]